MLVPTEVPGLDESIGGGFPEGSVILAEGGPGDGQDVFVRQVLHAKAVAGETVAYIVVGKSARRVAADMAVFGWNVGNMGGRWEFIESPAPTQLKGLLTALIRAGKWVAVDSLSGYAPALMREPHLASTLVDAVRAVTEAASEVGGLHFLLVTRGVFDPMLQRLLEDSASGVIEFNSEVTELFVKRWFVLRGLGLVSYHDRVVPFRVVDRGVVVETVSRVL